MSSPRDVIEPVLEPDPDDDGLFETPEPEPLSGRPARTARNRWRRGVARIKRSVVWTHRWSSLVLGVALLVVTTSGVPILYLQEAEHVTHSSAYDPSGGEPTLTFDEALTAARTHDPKFAPQSLQRASGVFILSNFDSGRRVTVDPANGQVLGDYDANDHSGVVPWTMSLMSNIHECGLTCDDAVGYVAFFNKKVPGTSWLGFESENVTVGGLILGITGVLLTFLALSGIWLWWPTIRRFATGVRVRWKKGRYARDFDLHQVVGMIALPLLLIWGVTGMGFEFGWVSKAWSGVTPGQPLAERTLESKPSKAPDIGLPAAIAAAQKELGRAEQPTSVDLPSARDAKATYGIWFADGYDPWNQGDYPGDLLVSVDRHSGNAAITYGGDEPMAQQLWEDWNFPLHAGWVVGPWLRIVWLVIGLVPLLLAFTALSTWLYKRGRRKRRRRLTAASPA